MKEVAFFVPGTPVAQPRVRPNYSGRGPAVFMPRSAQAWRELVAIHGRKAWTGEPSHAPIALEVRWILPRPKSHWTASGGLKASAPLFHVQTPDTDNLVKSTKDALNGITWRDDAQVYHEIAWKEWQEPGETPGAEITIREAI